MFVPVLYSNSYNNKQARMVFYEFIMGTNMFQVLRPKYGGLGAEPFLAIFVVFKLKYRILSVF